MALGEAIEDAGDDPVDIDRASRAVSREPAVELAPPDEDSAARKPVAHRTGASATSR
jgi:hypothetical protein